MKCYVGLHSNMPFINFFETVADYFLSERCPFHLDTVLQQLSTWKALSHGREVIRKQDKNTLTIHSFNF